MMRAENIDIINLLLKKDEDKEIRTNYIDYWINISIYTSILNKDESKLEMSWDKISIIILNSYLILVILYFCSAFEQDWI